MENKATTNESAVAVLGTGTMGSAMTRRLLQCGYGVRAWNRSPEPLAELAAAGAKTFVDPRDAVQDARAILTLLPTADVVTTVMINDGVVDAMTTGAVWVQMGTIGVEGTQRLDVEVRSRRPDVSFVDAPVSGSRLPAEMGALLIFGSGPDEARARVASVFDALGQRTMWLGPAGYGSRMKLVNNVLLAFTAEGVANSFGLAHQLGLQTASVIEAFDGGPLVSSWESGKFQRIAEAEYSPEFALALALKDVRLALLEGGADRFRVLTALEQEWTDIVDQGLGREDVTVVTRVLGG